MTKISIVMPIHNTPLEILKECLNSVFGQSFKEFEIICVNDGSTDIGIIECLNRYKKEYTENLIILQLKEALGAAQARNIGFAKAIGEYVIFLDSDDIFHRDMLFVMYENIKNKCADVCVCNFRVKYGNQYVYYGDYETDNKCADSVLGVTTNPWNKLIRREYLKENNIYFQTLTSCNDVYFSMMAILCTENICYLNDKYLVDYRADTPGSISNSKSRNLLNIWYAFEKVRKDINEQFGNYYDNLLNEVVLRQCIGQLKLHSEGNKRLMLYKTVKEYYIDKKIDNCYWENVRQVFVKYDYETKWFEHMGDFLFQLQQNKDKLLRKLEGYEIWLGGLGKRGQAFIRWADENNIRIEGAYDKKDDKCGTIVDDIKVFSKNEVLKKKDILLVASNSAVYDELKDIIGINLVNLEKYCPL